MTLHIYIVLYLENLLRQQICVGRRIWHLYDQDPACHYGYTIIAMTTVYFQLEHTHLVVTGFMSILT